MFCTKCGANMEDGATQCPVCGSPVADTQGQQQGQQQQAYNQQYQQPPYQQPIYQQPYQQQPRQINTGMLIWSILNIVFCCLPLGIVGLVMTLNAKSAMTPEEEQHKLSQAKTWNLIGTIAGAVVMIIIVVMYIVLGAAFFAGLSGLAY